MLYVIRQSAVDDLYLGATDPVAQARYRDSSGEVPIPSADLLASDIATEGPTPELSVSPDGKSSQDDVNNARKLYQWLRPKTWRQASDPRLWTFLSHQPFADYCRKRWPFASKGKTENLIRSRWILRGESRGAVSRHSIARLWWAADATWKASRLVPILADLEKTRGEWWFTDRLLMNQDAFQALRERKFGSNPLVLLAAIEALKDSDDKLGPAARYLGRELNILGRFQVLDTLDWGELLKRCAEILSGWRQAGAPAIDDGDVES